MKIKTSNKALLEIEEIYTYYFGQAGREIADRFRSSINHKYNLFYDNKIEIGSNKYSNKQNAKFLKLGKFPYLLFFIRNNDKDEIRVVRVLHEKRDIINLL